MKPDEFIAFLNENGIKHTINSQSIILEESPCCNSHKKIYLYREENRGKPLFGKCMKCDTSWSSWSYLREIGIDIKTIDALHGTANLNTASLGLAPIGIDLVAVAPKKAEIRQEQIYDISLYYKVTDLPDSAMSKYAIKRGWTPAQSEDILVDMFSQAVVFVCRENGKVVGTQHRYLKPPFPNMKVKSAPGFKKTQHILQFPNNGDILVCEGPFTALAAWHYGYHGVCTFGSSVSQRQIDLIASLAKTTGKKVGVAFDKDSAGKKGSKLVRLGMHWQSISTFQVFPEYGNDLNDSWMAKKGIIIKESDKDDITVPDLYTPDDWN